MDIKQMVYFKTIVEAGTISKAAEVLHMAQPPLSMQLKQLEQELGVQLLKRGHRKVELTQAGQLFYKRSIQMITFCEMTKHEMKNTQNEVLRIGITSSNSPLILNIQNYLCEHSELTFRIHEGTTYEMIDLLIAHNIDIAIVRTPFDQSQVNVHYFQKEPMIAVGTKQYLHQEMTHIKDYQNIPIIIHQRYLTLMTDYCLHLQMNPFIKMTSDDCRTSLIWASANLGVAIIPQSALSLIHDTNLITVPLKDEALYTEIVFVTRQHEELSLRYQELIQQFFL